MRPRVGSIGCIGATALDSVAPYNSYTYPERESYHPRRSSVKGQFPIRAEYASGTSGLSVRWRQACRGSTWSTSLQASIDCGLSLDASGCTTAPAQQRRKQLTHPSVLSDPDLNASRWSRSS